MAEIAVWLMPAPAEVSVLSLFSSRSLVSGGPAEVASLGLLSWWSIPCAFCVGDSLGPALEEGDFSGLLQQMYVPGSGLLPQKSLAWACSLAVASWYRFLQRSVARAAAAEVADLSLLSQRSLTHVQTHRGLWLWPAPLAVTPS